MADKATDEARGLAHSLTDEARSVVEKTGDAVKRAGERIRDWFRERRHTCDGLRSRCSRERVRLVAFNGVKVFSATLQRQRDELGEGVSQWLAANPAIRVVETVVWQSSGAEFHCLSITLFYEQEVGG